MPQNQRTGRSKRPREAANRSFGATAEAVASKAVDFALLGVLFVAPLFMGGRHPLGQFAFIALACVAAIAWCLKQSFSSSGRVFRSGAEWLLIAGVSLITLQMLPLSPAWLSRLSPFVAERLPLWSGVETATGHLGVWNTVSLAPEATRAGLAVFVAYALLFVVCVQRFRRLEDVESAVRWIAVAAVAMAAVGLLQFVASNGKFLWIYEHPSRDTRDAVKGAFANQNHFAHFLALGIGPVLWWLQRSFARKEGKAAGPFSAKPKRPGRVSNEMIFLVAGLGVLILASLLSFSRGGIVMVLLAALLCIVAYVRLGLWGRKALLGLGAVTAVTVAALAIHGHRRLATKWESVTQAESIDALTHGRSELWKSEWAAISEFPLLGSGVGSHREVLPTFFEKYSAREFTHAENGPLQVALETGFAGLLLLSAGICLCFFWAVRAAVRSPDRRNLAVTIALLSGLVVSVVHSAVDFVWYIPACMSVTVILAACTCRMSCLARSDRCRTEREPAAMGRPAWVALTAAVTLVAGSLVHSQFGPAMAGLHWDRYLAASYGSDAPDLSPADVEHLDLEMYGHLERVLAWHPDHARANLRMASVCARRFDTVQKRSQNAMPLAQVRDAAIASQFPDREALDRWLSAAVGENRNYLDCVLDHTRRGLRSCPLQGDGYLHLAEAGFLQGADASAKATAVRQALLVRPHTDSVLFAAGKEAALAADTPRALALWKKAFHQGPTYRRQIIELLAAQVPPAFFVQTFEPDVDGLALLYAHFIERGQTEHVDYVTPVYLEALESSAKSATPEKAAHCWLLARGVHSRAKRYGQALACSRRAATLDPNNFIVRRALAYSLLQQKQYGEAIEHFQWCVHRSPTDTALRRQLDQTIRLNVRVSTATPRAGPNAMPNRR